MLPDSLVEHYSSKTDDELLALAANPDSLVEEARPILADELRRRNLAAQSSLTAVEHQSPNVGSRAVAKLRTIGAFLLNLVIALLGTGIIESSIWAQLGHARSLPGIEARVWLLSPAIAALLGFSFVDAGVPKARCGFGYCQLCFSRSEFCCTGVAGPTAH